MPSIPVQPPSLKGVTLDCDVVAAARFMTSRDVSALGVFSHNGHDLLGVITERDITRTIASGHDPATTPVQDVMTTELVTAGGDVTDEQARELMKSHNIRHLIVEQDGVQHILSLLDL